eukprot:CAMPEP_0171120324 /NCGR_PEP_ID=MMETSP0766_2-20121228/99418_1 /TAXON_ID=439317 /ORGANISM="Gambierdiscus australes, Strain CAWD 149" /LENGTH=75 /DNA_ID=CAMNT_0011583043 /DNA_START=179 /DNA_END=402 /DNA_ORIENTATION=-
MPARPHLEQGSNARFSFGGSLPAPPSAAASAPMGEDDSSGNKSDPSMAIKSSSSCEARAFGPKFDGMHSMHLRLA